MVGLKALKLRTHSVKAIEKVTQVMKLVSISKLKKARDLFEGSQQYMRIITETLLSLVKELEEDDKQTLEEMFPLLMGREGGNKYLLIVVGSERGLCGSFNNNLAKEVRESAQKLIQDGQEVSVLCIGDKTYRMLRVLQDIPVKLLERSVKTIEEIREFTQELYNKFLANDFDVCEVYYSAFVSPLVQKSTSRTLVPIYQPLEVESADCQEPVTFEFEPSRGTMLRELAVQFLADLLFAVVLEASASEHAARVTAMDNAASNATDIIDSLVSVYNKKRQGKITTELIEIISGSEAINVKNI